MGRYPDSNREPSDPHSDALPLELYRPKKKLPIELSHLNNKKKFFFYNILFNSPSKNKIIV